MIRLTSIGTGTVAPDANRVCSSHLVESGDARILLDCGSGAVFRMGQLGIDWVGITHILISHFHPDHISDIPLLMYAWRYGTLPPRAAAVSLIGPPGWADLFGRLDALYDGSLGSMDYGVSVVELPPGEQLELGSGVQVSSLRVPHTPESVAYSVVAQGRRVVYTGDTGPSQELAAWAAGCDLLLAECSLPAELGIPSHLTPEDCAALAGGATPGALALTHFYPPVGAVDVPGIIAGSYNGPVHMTWDGWKYQTEE